MLKNYLAINWKLKLSMKNPMRSSFFGPILPYHNVTPSPWKCPGTFFVFQGSLISIDFPVAVLFYFLFFIFFVLLLIFFFKRHRNWLLILAYLEIMFLILGLLFAFLSLVSPKFSAAIVYSLILLAMAAAETVVGLTLVLLYFRANKGNIDISKDFFPDVLEESNKKKSNSDLKNNQFMSSSTFDKGGEQTDKISQEEENDDDDSDDYDF